MKSLLLFFLFCITAAANAQTLGTYPNATITTGQNTTVTPGAAPTGTTSVVAYTNTNFTGTLAVNLTTGVVTVTNAKQAGTYTVTVQAFGSGTATTTFTLTVSNPTSCQGVFTGATNISVGTSPILVAIGDFNGDGNQDFAATNDGSSTVSIRLGDGLGGFSGTTNVSVGSNPRSVAIGDFNGDGKQDFAAANHGSNTVSIRLGDGLGGFSGTTNISVGANPRSVAIGDFNGDGKQDFATANEGSTSVSIRLGNGLGGFSGTTNISVGTGPISVAIGDFNGDGKQDFVAANFSSNTVSIRLGDGLGGFGGTTNISVGTSPFSVAIGDFNGDGNQDFAAANYSSNTVSIRLGDGLGGFSGSTNIGVGTNPYSVAIGDFNGDGKQDFAAANQSSNSVSIRLGDGLGGFSGTTNVSVGATPTSVVIGDFNGDGKQDFAATNYNSANVSIRLGGINEINVRGNSTNIADGDATPDLTDHSDFGNANRLIRTYTIQNTGTGPLTVTGITLSGGDASQFTVGALTPASPIAASGSATFTVTFAATSVGPKSTTVLIASDDCDEAVYDFAIQGTAVQPTIGGYANTTITTGQNTTITPTVVPTNTVSGAAYTTTNFTGLFSVNPATGVVTLTNALQAGVYTVTVRAINGALSATTTFTLTINNPVATCQAVFGGSTNVSVGTSPYSAAIGDFNGDGKQDIAAANYNSNNVSIRLGDGLGGFSGSTNVAVGASPVPVAIGDFNGDGNQDIAVGNSNTTTVSIRLGDGAGGFSGTTNVSVGSQPYAVAIGDFNGDGNQDFAAANTASGTVSIRLGDGLGGFSGSTNLTVGTTPYSVAVGDFNGDGNQDIVVASYGSNNVSIRLGDGFGGFGASTTIAAGTSCQSVAIGDFNADGKQDIAVANRTTSGTVSIRLGDGLGGFTGSTSVAVGTNPYSVLVGDFNGDGKQDLATTNNGSNNVSIRLGDGLGGFSGVTNVVVGSSPYSVAVGDFNGDGSQDIAAANILSNTVSIRLGGGVNEINVRGNSTNIGDGDATPDLADHTDFGNTSNAQVRTFTIQNTSTAPLTIANITLSGGDASQFTVGALTPASPIAGGSSATFTVTFASTSVGLKTTTVRIASDDCDEADYDFGIQGTAVQPTIGGYANTTITTGQNTTITPTVAPTNTLTGAAYTTTNFTGLFSVNPATGIVTITNPKQAGVYTVTVKAINGAISATTTFTLTINNPVATCQALFGGTTNTATGTNPQSVAVGDFNGDGMQDIAAANKLSNTVSIRLGNGSGGLTGSTNVSVGTAPVSAAIGDFNGDGNQDIAAANNTSNTVSIRLGNGIGGFSGTTNVSVGSAPQSVAIGDFNGDDKQDIAVVNSGATTVSIRIGDGLGGFSGSTDVAVGNQPYWIATGDFNGDSKLDFAVTNSGLSMVSIKLGDGLGGFSGSTTVAVSSIPYSVAIGDFNGDGNQDIAVANYGSNTVSIRLGNGSGGFTGSTNVAVGTNPYSVAIGDFNGDGKQDFAAANSANSGSGNSVSIRLGDGLGGFSGTTTVAVGTSPWSIATGDFNADGIQDFTVANNLSGNVSIRLGGVNEINVRGNSTNIVDGDATPDLADHTDLGNTNNGQVRTYTIQNTGTGPLTVTGITLSGGDASQFTVGTLTPASPIAGGGSATFTVTFAATSVGLKSTTVLIASDDCDEAVYDFAIQGTAVQPTFGGYANTTITTGQNTTITPTVALTNTLSGVAYTTTNFTGLLSVNPATGIVTVTNAKQAGVYTITLLAINGALAATTTFTLTINNPVSICQTLFSSSPNVAVGTAPRSVAIGDFNGDGKQDIAVANLSTNNVSIRLGNGLGGFTGSTDVAVETGPISVAIGDFNNDGRQDFAAANSSSNTVSIRLGDGLGAFSGSTNVAVGSNPRSVAIGDFNGDGKQDIATANYNTTTVSIRLGDGLGGFSGSTNLVVGTSPSSIAIGDFNTDGKQDFAVTIQASGIVSIRLGDGLGGFTGTTTVAVESQPSSVVIGDFNGDGLQDIAAANSSSASVSIRLGNGLGAFSGTMNVAVGSQPYAVAIGDFNGDGKQDFAAANSFNGTGGNTVSIRLGDGLGSFTGTTNVAVGTSPFSLAIADFNGDGIQDFTAGTAPVSIRLGGVSEINVLGNSTNIANGDNTPDLADHTEFGNTNVQARTYTIQNTGTVPLRVTGITLSGGDASQFTVGALSPASPIAAGGSATFTVSFTPTTAGFKTTMVRIANDDCDEAVYDFAIQGTAVQPTIGGYANTTITTGQNTTIIPTAAPANYLNVAASTSTNFTGLLLVNAATGVITVTNPKQMGVYTVTVRATNGSLSATTTFTLSISNPVCSEGLFSGTSNSTVGTNPHSVVIGDFNGDGRQDIAVANYFSNTISIRIGDGLGGFSGTTNVAVGAGPLSVAIGDFNGDGRQDIAAANFNSNNVSIRIGDGLGGFSGSTEFVVGTNPYSVAIGDFNADGKQDFASANFGSNSVSIRVGDGLGGFSGSTNVTVGSSPYSVAIGDFNADGNQDIAAANFNSATVSIRLGDGLGGFSGSTNVAVGTQPSSVAIGDFNADGKQDIAVSNYGSGTVSIRLGDGLGGFTGSTSVAVGSNPYSVATGDFNGDGKQDIATANNGTNNVSIRVGDGLGGFSGVTNVTVGLSPRSVAIGDFNADGIQDIAAASYISNIVSIRLGIYSEINVQGNSSSIADGDVTPGLAEHTDFSSVATGSSFTRTFTLQNTGTAALTITGISVTGANASEFVVTTAPASSVAAAGSTTFLVTFTPTGPGTRTATLSIANTDCDEASYDIALQGTGCANITLASNLDVATTSIVPGANPIFVTGDPCEALLSIAPNGANPVSGSVTTKVWVESTQPSYNGRPYLKRHYEITPATNAATATAKITLYATQAEFDAFNQFPFNGDDLPTGPADNAGIANIRFYKYGGTSSDGSGSPGSYQQPGLLIDPVNTDIIWNSILNRWEISFDVTGFSGFFGGNAGATILPLQLLSFNGSKQANGTLLTWNTANEQNTKSFELESSTDGRRFTKIATLNAAGNGSHSYSYTDATIYKDKVWYRLKMLDADGKFTYSSVLLMNQSTNQPITIFPNPAISVLNINISDSKLLNTNVKVTDTKGSVVQVVRLSGYNQPVNIEGLAKGMYLTKFADGTVIRFIKK